MRKLFQKWFDRQSVEEEAQAIVAEAVQLPTLQAMQSLSDWLERDIAGPDHSKTRLSLLQAIDHDLRVLIESALADMVDGHANFARLSVLLKATRQFATVILAAYSSALRDEAKSLAAKPEQARLVRDAIANCLYWIGREYLLAYVQERDLHSLPWRNIGDLVAFAAGLAQDAAAPTTSQGDKSQIDKQLARLLILARTLTTDFHGRALLIADKLAELLAGFVTVAHQQLAGAPDSRIYEGGKAEPILAVPNMSTAPRMVYYGLFACQSQLDDLEAIIMRRHQVPAKIDPKQLLNVPETLSVIRYLKKRWAGQEVKRGAERRPVKGKLLVSYGLDGIHGLGAARKARDWALESEVGAILRVEALTQAQAEAEMASKLAEHEDHVHAAEALNMSSNGIGFEISGAKKPATVGDLICLRTEKDLKWHLGIIRRVFTERYPAQTVGVQLISSRPESVRLIAKGDSQVLGPSNDDDVKTAPKVVYARPEPRNDNQHLLISVDPDLTVGNHYAALMTEDGDKLLRVDALKEVGVGRVVYRCERVA